MHHFGLIHKDIKPDNILISPRGEFVLVDFNISTHIFERPGQKSLTYQEGTRRYMSPEMKNIQRDVGEVDLYYNDMWGLQKAIKILQNYRSESKLKSFPADLSNKPVNTIALLSSLLSERERMPNSNELRQKLATSSFAAYFSEINEAVIESDFDLDFLVRSVGLSSDKLFYLIGCVATSTRRIIQLQQKLKRLSVNK